MLRDLEMLDLLLLKVHKELLELETIENNTTKLMVRIMVELSELLNIV
jgi:hypothetical protein